MKLKAHITILLVLIASISFSQSLDEILQQHYENMGFNQVEDVHSLRITGKFHNHFLKKISTKLPESLMKPDFILSVEKGKSYLLQTFGVHGENVVAFSNSMFWLGSPGAEPQKWDPISPDRLKIQLELYPLGFLFDYKELGHQLQKLNDLEIGGKDHFQLQLITSHAATIYYYLDKKKFYIQKICFNDSYQPDLKQASYTNLKFTKVNGIVFPVRQMYRTQMLDGSYDNKEVLIDKIEVNPTFNKEHFSFDNRIHKSKNN